MVSHDFESNSIETETFRYILAGRLIEAYFYML